MMKVLSALDFIQIVLFLYINEAQMLSLSLSPPNARLIELNGDGNNRNSSIVLNKHL
jgi:hypothetical protein